MINREKKRRKDELSCKLIALKADLNFPVEQWLNSQHIFRGSLIMFTYGSHSNLPPHKTYKII